MGQLSTFPATTTTATSISLSYSLFLVVLVARLCEDRCADVPAGVTSFGSAENSYFPTEKAVARTGTPPIESRGRSVRRARYTPFGVKFGQHPDRWRRLFD